MPLLHNTYLSQSTFDDLTAILPEVGKDLGSDSAAIEHIVKMGIAAAISEANAAKLDAANAQPSA